MDVRDQGGYHHQYHLYAPPEAQHHLILHQHQQNPTLTPLPYAASSSSSFPNLNHNGYVNPLPSSATAASADDVLPPPPDPSHHYDPYASRMAYDGAHTIASQSFPPTAAGYYYQQQQQQQQQLAAYPLAYGVVGTGNTTAALEAKRRKVIAGGASSDSVRVCTVCDVVCNSDKVFAFHLAGEKHALKALGIPPNPMKPKVAAHMNALHLTDKATHPAPRITPQAAAKKAAKRLISFVQSSHCDVCNVDCNSQEAWNSHRMGRKHLRNLQKLQEATKPNPANAQTNNLTPTHNASAGQNSVEIEQPKQNASPAPGDDLETKKQKVLAGGAAAVAVRLCAYCNVVCNSQSVYNSHIAGKKHVAMVNKQQQAAPVS